MAAMVSITRRGPVPWRHWRHATKLDPDRPHDPALLASVLQSGTDAILIGGSQGITREKVARLLAALAGRGVPVAIEVSTPEAVVPGADLYLIPSVLNSPHGRWVLLDQAAHLAAVMAAMGLAETWSAVPWPELVPEAYLIMNPASAAAALTGVQQAPGRAEATACAALAGRLWRLPLIYVEYSGQYGDPDLVQAVRTAAGPAHLFYGGGIDGPERAAEMAARADTVVVGNLVYAPGGPAALAETVAAVRA